MAIMDKENKEQIPKTIQQMEEARYEWENSSDFIGKVKTKVVKQDKSADKSSDFVGGVKTKVVKQDKSADKSSDFVGGVKTKVVKQDKSADKSSNFVGDVKTSNTSLDSPKGASNDVRSNAAEVTHLKGKIKELEQMVKQLKQETVRHAEPSKRENAEPKLSVKDLMSMPTTRVKLLREPTTPRAKLLREPTTPHAKLLREPIRSSSASNSKPEKSQTDRLLDSRHSAQTSKGGGYGTF